MKKLMSYTEFKNKIIEKKRIKVVGNVILNSDDIKFTQDLGVETNLWKFYNAYFEYVKENENNKKEFATVSRFFSKYLKGIGKAQKEVYENIVSAMFGNTTVFNYVFHTVPKDIPDFRPESFEDMVYYFQYFKYVFISVVENMRIELIDYSKKNGCFEVVVDYISSILELKPCEKYKSLQFPKLLTTFMSYYYRVHDINDFFNMITNGEINFNFDMETIVTNDMIEYLKEIDFLTYKNGDITNLKNKEKSVSISNVTTRDRIFMGIEEAILLEYVNSKNISKNGKLIGDLKYQFIFSDLKMDNYKLQTYLDFVPNSYDDFYDNVEASASNNFNLYELDFLIKLDVLSKKKNKKLYNRNSTNGCEKLNNFVTLFVKKVEETATRMGKTFNDSDLLFVGNRYLLIFRSFEYLYTCVNSLDVSICKKFYKDYGCLLFAYLNEYSLNNHKNCDNYLYRNRDYINCLRLKLGLSIGKKLLKTCSYPEITSFDDCNFKIILEDLDINKSKTDILKDFFDKLVWFEPMFLIYYIANSISNDEYWTQNIHEKIKKIFINECNKIKEFSGVELEILGQDVIPLNQMNTKKRNNLINSINSIAKKDMKNVGKYIKAYNSNFHYEEDEIIKNISNTGTLEEIQTLLLSKGFKKSEKEISDRLRELNVRRGFDNIQKEEYINKVKETGDMDGAFNEVFGSNRTAGSSRGLKIDVAAGIIKDLHSKNKELEEKNKMLTDKMSSFETDVIIRTLELDESNKIAVNDYKKLLISKVHDNFVENNLTEKELMFIIKLINSD